MEKSEYQEASAFEMQLSPQESPVLDPEFGRVTVCTTVDHN